MVGVKGRSGRRSVRSDFKKISISFSLSDKIVSLLFLELKRLGWKKRDKSKLVEFILSKHLFSPKERALFELELSEQSVAKNRVLVDQLSRREKLLKEGEL